MTGPDDAPDSLPPQRHSPGAPSDRFSGRGPEADSANWSYIPEYPPRRPTANALRRRPSARVWIVILTFATAYFCLWLIGELLGSGNEIQLFVVAGLEYLPFLPLTAFAYLSSRVSWARTLTLGYWLFLVGGAALVMGLLTVESLLDADEVSGILGGDRIVRTARLFRPDSLLRAGLTVYGMGFGVLIGLLAFLPAVRRFAARVLPLDPQSFVHATALATVLGLSIVSFVPLVASGEPPLLALAPVIQEANERDTGNDTELRSTIYGFLWLVPATMVAVGYPLRRSLPDTLRRIGLVRPSVRQLVVAVLTIPVLVGMMLAIDNRIGEIWTQFDWPTTDSQAFDELMKFAFNPIGAVVIGITAGLGEELAVRGVLQPRLGIVLANLFFTSLHALQYNWDGLLSVFLIGLVLGTIRKYTNTTTSAIVHGGYDFVLVMLEVIHRQFANG